MSKDSPRVRESEISTLIWTSNPLQMESRDGSSLAVPPQFSELGHHTAQSPSHNYPPAACILFASKISLLAIGLSPCCVCIVSSCLAHFDLLHLRVAIRSNVGCLHSSDIELPVMCAKHRAFLRQAPRSHDRSWVPPPTNILQSCSPHVEHSTNVSQAAGVFRTAGT